MLQIGDRHEILTHPRSRFVAELTGVNFYEGAVNPKPANGHTEVRVGSATLYANYNQAVTGATLLTFFPSDVVLTRSSPTTGRTMCSARRCTRWCTWAIRCGCR